MNETELRDAIANLHAGLAARDAVMRALLETIPAQWLDLLVREAEKEMEVGKVVVLNSNAPEALVRSFEAQMESQLSYLRALRQRRSTGT